MGLVQLMLLFILAIGVFYCYCVWRIYEKAGQPGWAALIPVYNLYILTRIIGKPWWWALVLCCTGCGSLVYAYLGFWSAMIILTPIGMVFGIWALYLLSKSFGKDEVFTFLLIFFWYIFIPIMAFADSIRYQGPAGSASRNINDQIQSIGADLK